MKAKKKPDPIASAMAAKRWAKTTPEERKAISVEMTRIRQRNAAYRREYGALEPLESTDD